MENASYEPDRGRHWLQLAVLAALLIVGLLSMHTLVNGAASTATSASRTSKGHASEASEAVNAPLSTTSGSHGMVHGSCAAAMSSGTGTACAPGPTGKTFPALSAPLAAILPNLGIAPETVPPPETPRRLALSHRELSIYRT